MKAISLWQPWASAIAVGAKRIETRSWPTSYRGPIAIHAAKRHNVSELNHFGCCWNWCGALWPIGLSMGSNKRLHELLPFGAIVAVAELVDCRPTGSFTNDELDSPRHPDCDNRELYAWTERQLGDFSLGRFGWVLEGVWRIPKPIPYIGAQGLFEAEPGVVGRDPEWLLIPDPAAETEAD